MSIPRAATSVVMSTGTFLALNFATWILRAVCVFGITTHVHGVSLRSIACTRLLEGTLAKGYSTACLQAE